MQLQLDQWEQYPSKVGHRLKGIRMQMQMQIQLQRSIWQIVGMSTRLSHLADYSGPPQARAVPTYKQLGSDTIFSRSNHQKLPRTKLINFLTPH